MSERRDGAGAMRPMMTTGTTFAADLASRLAQNAEAVCRHYLSNGRRYGGYWLVGDAHNTPGRSLYVRLVGATSGKGAAGKWTDAGTGEHGDLLDLIRTSCRLTSFRETAEEAARFLGLPANQNRPTSSRPQHDSVAAARRLFAVSRPIAATVAERYLRRRGITQLHGTEALRFHPSCTYRLEAAADASATATWPALIAAVTDDDGALRGVHRTWLDGSTCTKAPVATPRRAMGNLLGRAVRFGTAGEVMAIGEGIETVLSVRTALTRMPMLAALSASHLPSVAVPAELKRLYILRDNDQAGIRAAEALSARLGSLGIKSITLVPKLGDFNDDLRTIAFPEFCASICAQIDPGDVARFMNR